MPVALSQTGLIADTWLAGCLGRDVYRLPAKPLDGPGALDNVRELCCGVARGSMVYARVPVGDVPTVGALQGLTFRLVDTNVTLERPLLERCEPGSGAIRPARPSDESQVVALARTSFTHSRFHQDPAIGADRADRLKGEWVANFFRGRRGDAMVVALEGDRIIGFLLALAADDDAVVIDLVAVDESCRGRRIAGALTQAAQLHWPEATGLRVGTQLANVAALGAYQGLGFAVTSAAYVLHFHRR